MISCRNKVASVLGITTAERRATKFSPTQVSVLDGALDDLRFDATQRIGRSIQCGS